MTPHTDTGRAQTVAGSSHAESRAGTGAADVPTMARRVPFAWLVLITSVGGWIASGMLVLEKIEKLRDP